MEERAAFRSVFGVLLVFFFLIVPAAVLAEEATAAPAESASPAPAPEAPAASAPSAPEAAPTVPPEATPAPPAPVLDAGTAPEPPPEAAPPAPAPTLDAGTAPEGTSERVPSASSTEAAPAAPAEAGSPAPAETAPAAETGVTKASEYPDGLIHSVVQGDTLWDLSAKYLGSPWRWTELWERNRFLTNPHYIYPGIRVVIFPPPPKEYAMEVVEPGAEPEAAPAVAPPPSAAEESIPPSAAEAVPMRGTLSITPSEYVRAGEFLLNRPRGIGKISGASETRVVFAEGEKVVLSLNKEIPAGQLLGVYRVRGPVRAPAGRRLSGYVRYLVGIIQALGEENGAVVGVIRKSFEELTRTDYIAEDIPGYLPVVLDPGMAGLEASVITGRRENKEFAEGDFIFLDKGSDAGVAKGNTFRLFRRAPDSRYRVEVARAVAVRVLPDTTTVYVVNSTQSFEAGILASRGEAPAR